MQELRFVLIIVGALAIAALLFHGLWTSKKEGKAKFGDKPLGKLDNDSLEDTSTAPTRSFAPEDDFEIIRKERKEPDFTAAPTAADPLIDSDVLMASHEKESKDVEVELDDIPSFSVKDTAEEPMYTEPMAVETPEPVSNPYSISDLPPQDAYQAPQFDTEAVVKEEAPHAFSAVEAEAPQEEEPEEELNLEVIVLNVHCAGDTPFIGTELFRSMENNGLTYGEMSIYHYYAEGAETPKVIFSVANMMQPGTLEHDNRAEFSTKGISFFMTLPCYGQADHNFNIMLQTAQRIADDMGGNVLDESRNLMTPSRLSDYRMQIRNFMAEANA